MALAPPPPSMWTAPGSVASLLSGDYGPNATAGDAACARSVGDHAQQNSSRNACNPTSSLPELARPAAAYAQQAHAANAQEGLMQSLLFQGSWAGAGAGGAGGQGSEAGRTATGAGLPAHFDQQALLLHILAAQQQMIAAQSGQLEAAAGGFMPGWFAQGSLPGLQHHLGQAQAPSNVAATNATHHAAASDAANAGQGPTVSRQSSSPALHRAFSANSAAEPTAAPEGGELAQVQGRLELVFPRRGRKAGEAERKVQDPVLITYQVMQRLFHLPLTEAARQLGLSPTAIKGACRRLGIKKWPFRMVTAKSHRRAPRAKAEGPSGLSLLSAAAEVELNNSSTEFSSPSSSPVRISSIASE